MMNFIKKYSELIKVSIVVATAFCGMTAYIVGSIHGVENRLNIKISSLEKDIVIIKTVLIMKNILPTDLALNKISKNELEKN